MSSEEKVQKAVDALVARLHEAMESEVRGLVLDVVRRANAEREIAVAEASASADARAANAKQEAETEVGRIRQESDAAITAAQKAAEAQVADARHQAQSDAERTRSESEVAIAKAREEILAERDELIQAEVSKVQQQAESALTSSLTEAQSAADESASSARVAARSEMQQELTTETARVREEARRGQQAALAAVSRLLDAVRRLDAEPNLTAVLDTLTELAAVEAGRVALFVVRDSQIRGWRLAGFGPEAGEARNMVLEGPATGFLARVLEQRQPVALPAGRPVDSADRPPGFAQLSEGRQALGMPVLIGGEVMVLVYADDANTEGRAMLSQWGEAVELLARHAGHRLEALTADRAARYATGAVPRPLKIAAAEEIPAEPPAGAGSEEEEAARRYARLLVSEIKLYNEAAVEEGRQERNLGDRLRAEIDRARSLYEQRIPDTVRSRALFFEQELIRTLADGDPSLMGT